jgi:proline iminopeptidase
VAGHSWGAELALRYASRHQDRTTAVAYIAGVGAGNGFREAFAAELDRRLGPTRSSGAAVNMTANRELWADRESEDLRLAAARITCPVTMLFGADDPQPWTADDSLLAAIPNASRIVLDDAGHAPWAERPAQTRRVIIDALRPALHGALGSAVIQAVERDLLQQQPGRGGHRDGHQRADDA